MTDWKHHITGLHPIVVAMDEEAVSFVEGRDAYVKVLDETGIFTDEPIWLNELRYADTPEEFEEAQDEMYDYCDASLIWINPIE